MLLLLLLLKKNSAQHRKGDIFFVRVDKSHWAKFLTECDFFYSVIFYFDGMNLISPPFSWKFPSLFIVNDGVRTL